jgi:hypothetical protein
LNKGEKTSCSGCTRLLYLHLLQFAGIQPVMQGLLSKLQQVNATVIALTASMEAAHRNLVTANDNMVRALLALQRVSCTCSVLASASQPCHRHYQTLQLPVACIRSYVRLGVAAVGGVLADYWPWCGCTYTSLTAADYRVQHHPTADLSHWQPDYIQRWHADYCAIGQPELCACRW